MRKFTFIFLSFMYVLVVSSKLFRMTTTEIELCKGILEDHFGYYVSIVGGLLLSNKLPFGLIFRNMEPKLSSMEIRRSMVILEHHNLLDVQNTPRGVLYSIIVQNVLRLIRIPRSILIVKTMFGEIAEALFEEVASKGRISCSDCIRKVCSRLEKKPPEIKSKFVALVEAHMIIRCPQVSIEEPNYLVFEDYPDPFLMPTQIMDGCVEQLTTSNTQTKKLKTTPDSDSKILWRINWIRIERFLRDETILLALSQNEVFDNITLQIAQLLIKVGEVKSDIAATQSQAISLQDVFRYSKDNNLSYTRDQIRDKLNILCLESNGIIRRIGESAGGLYIINYEKGIELLCLENIESAIREKLDDKAVRIFRLLYIRGYLEEDQIEKHAMLSTKETKTVCYSLLDHNFITTRQIARTNDFAPARTIYLFGINNPQALGTMILFSTKAIRNVMRRRMHEAKLAEPLTDKKLKMEIIISKIESDTNVDEETKKQQVVEVEEVYMTKGDKTELEKHKKGQQVFWTAEIELERVLFVFQQYSMFKRAAAIQILNEKQSRKRKRREILT